MMAAAAAAACHCESDVAETSREQSCSVEEGSARAAGRAEDRPRPTHWIERTFPNPPPPPPGRGPSLHFARVQPT